MVHNITVYFVCTFLTCFCSRQFCAAEDTMKHSDIISDDGTSGTTSLVSAGGSFELGFFSPDDGSSSGGINGRKRYIGIWYHNLANTTSKTIVWVANRDDPIHNSSGVFRFAEDGNLKLMDKYAINRKPYWSTDLENSSPTSTWTVQLMDSGNLVVNQSEVVLWQSFKNPTDTFLPGMRMDKKMKLISWRDEGDPGAGGFSFVQDQDRDNHFLIMNKSVTYWKSGESGDLFSSWNAMPDRLVQLLSEADSEFGKVMLVMRSNGLLVFEHWDPNRRAWSIQWWEPNDMCSVYNVCGNFGSCDGEVENRLACNCLPGFKPRSQQQWGLGEYWEGCERGKEVRGKDETFVRLGTVKIGKQADSDVQVENEIACRKLCLDSPTCQAYSPQIVQKVRRDSVFPPLLCWIWNDYLNDLREDHAGGGQSVFVRVALSDLKPTTRNCEPCGTNAIPYPLSTGPDCGDLMYLSFRCDNSTGRVSFKVSGSEYRMTSINPSKHSFFILVKDVDNCGVRSSRGQNLLLNASLPFNVTGLTSWCDSKVLPRGMSELEIMWEPPGEPTCTSQENCEEWPNSTCSNANSKEKKRCLCNANFDWNGLNLTCVGTKPGGAYQPPEGKRQRKEVPLSLIVLPTALLSVILIAFAVLFFLIWRRKIAKREENRESSDRRNRALRALDSEKRIKDLMDYAEFKEDDKEGLDVPFFDLDSILAVTDGFSDENKLGQGGYGPVYKGKFPGGQEIAIKRLSSVSGQGLQEFKNEVILIARLQHRNLVKLLGYCMERDEKILIYEFMPNKSLDYFIFDDAKSVLLDWKIRFDIILGIARGLLYLHQDSRLRIIHRDLKTSNILLDKDMNPKIADFGLARMVGGKETEANTGRIVGTYGYMSPEYALEGIFSVKSDVFSFGVVLLEIVSGKRNKRFVLPEQPISLLGYAWRLWTENRVLDFMVPSLRESCKVDQITKCVNVALLCVQEDPSDRPNMSNVITMLDSETATLPSPKQPAFVLRRGCSTASSSKQETPSEITFTTEDAR